MNRVRVKGIAFTYFKSFLRDKSSLFWVIGWPILILLLTVYVFIPPSAGAPMTMSVGVVNQDNSSSPFNGTVLVEILNETNINGTRVFRVVLVENQSVLEAMLSKGELDAGIIIPEGFGETIMFGQAGLKVLVTGDSMYELQVRRAILSEFFKVLERNIAIQKIKNTMKYIASFEGVANKTITVNGKEMPLQALIEEFMYGLAQPLNITYTSVSPKGITDRASIIGWYTLGDLGMMMMYTGLVVGATAIVEEKEKGRLKRLLSTPITESDLLAGKMLGGFMVLSLSSLILLALGVALGAKISWTPFEAEGWLVVLHYLLMATMTIGLGFLISLASRTERGAGNLAIMLGLLLSFTAGIWFPAFMLPSPLKALARVFPVTRSLDTVRNIVIYGYSCTDVAKPTIYAIAWTAIIIILGVYAFRRSLRRYVET